MYLHTQQRPLSRRQKQLNQQQSPNLACMVVSFHLSSSKPPDSWIYLFQEALLYEAWEPAVLRHPGFEPVTCPDSGRPLFAGPRLRMGLAEGPPHSVLPDHSGRANYSVS